MASRIKNGAKGTKKQTEVEANESEIEADLHTIARIARGKVV